jgi:uncharacterized protein
MSPSEIIKIKREEILRIASRYGAGNVRVFGSTARGEAGPDSDLDLLVTPGPGMTLIRHSALVRELTEQLGCRVDVISDRGLKPRMRERVMNEAFPL